MCGIARALDLVGERWALLVVRELLYGPKRFTDLRRGLPALGPDILSQRLRDLEGAGVLHKRKLEPPASAQVYELTPRGRGLEGVLLELGRWGAAAPLAADDAAFSPDSLILALRTTFDPTAAGSLEACVELRFPADRFRVAVGGGELQAERGGAAEADALLEADAHTLAGLLWRGRRLDDAIKAGEARVGGSKRQAARFIAAFPAPAIH
jgi:DNA-binding HxlR family transcriptional regulator